MRPVYVEKLWGGSRIGRLPAKARPGHEPPALAVGESWEVSDLPEGQSTVDDAPGCSGWAGHSLGQMVSAFGPALIGTGVPEGRFPILVKLIDAAEPLSVQVHPGADYAAAHPGTFSKDEAWLVIDTAVGGSVLHGFVDGVSAALFKDAVKKGLPHELMRHVEVKAGDVMHVSPGVVHAIGAGIVILEVQEPSDTTFRVWDFNRRDQHGRLRALHLEEAMAVARFGPQPPPLTEATTTSTSPGGLTTLCETKAFAMRALMVNGPQKHELPVSTTTALVLHAEEGDVVFAHDDVTTTIPRGGTVILPASCGGVVFPAGARGSRVIIMHGGNFSAAGATH
jgi:mannose-6-phosphate isomerase